MQMNSRRFEDWLETFRASINTYDYYTDFKKVRENVYALRIEISTLNALLYSDDVESDFEHILIDYPKCLKVIPLLLAVRKNELYCQDENGAFNYKFDNANQSIAQYKYFMRQTGLFDLLENHIISNLYDYLTGVEVGLDSNGRKNRGGHQMENLVEKFLRQAGVEYRKEIYLTDIFQNKRWDFVVETADKIFALETNFYTDGGSKLNETARSYKLIAEEAENIDGFKFIWITDGEGWRKAKQNLRETFLVLRDLYNITDLENGIFLELFK